ncbi:uncharacterized protein L203_100598 [Cryptococcus depauperatus CBS 7841]|uniref:Histone deacetylase domain-containing protein n=1 Tax=Cryptococcus depauperatus CBS 7841 TaxID=1295531 RepID=A0AAJ8JNC9_9TREE
MSSKAPAIPPFDPTPLQRDGRRVAYYYDQDVGNYHFGLGHPMKPHRIRMAHNLVVNYGLADEDDEEEYEGKRKVNAPIGMDKEDGRWMRAVARGYNSRGMQVFRPHRATKNDITKFHTDEYVDLLEQVMPETADILTGNGTRCLTGTDCPAVEGIFEFSSISAGGSIGAAERLNTGAADIAINWAGGLHHAKKSEASGFCYVNDIVLGILELLRFHSRVLYIDIDVHHGDGIEEAFYTTDRVMTCSFHMYGNFFPGTGHVKDIGLKKGKGYAVNVPLKEGITDDGFQSIFKPVVRRIMEHYRPGAIVLQGGADSVSGDKLGKLNLTLKGHAECARFLRSFNMPLMMLGGGGYTTKNVARAWTKETAVAVGKELSEELPNNQYMEYYGPRYKLEVLPSNADDCNTPDYLENLKRQIFEHLKDLPFAPSAQMRIVPSNSVSKAIGLREWDAEDPEDQIDQHLKKLLARRNLNGTYEASGNGSWDGNPIKRSSHITRPSRSSTTIHNRRKRYSDEAVEDADPCGADRTNTIKMKNKGNKNRRMAGEITSTTSFTAHIRLKDCRQSEQEADSWETIGRKSATVQRPTPESEDEDVMEKTNGKVAKEKRPGKRRFFSNKSIQATSSKHKSINSISIVGTWLDVESVIGLRATKIGLGGESVVEEWEGQACPR